jgi:CDP-diacylglycerol---glycerol-3-phosphate 3-phosphatidyltransferase
MDRPSPSGERPHGRSRSRSTGDGKPNGVVPHAADLRLMMRERLIESRLTPNAISITGLILTLAAVPLIAERKFFLAGLFFIFGSVSDALDGRYSRMSGKGSTWGAFLDSTLDRIGEGLVLAAIAAYFASRGDEFLVALVVGVVLGSFMVSYTRARAEALGVECKVGLAPRTVRVTILSIGLVFAKGAGIFDIELLAASIWVLAALTTFTVAQRVWHVRRQLLAGPNRTGPVTDEEPVGTST